MADDKDNDIYDNIQRTAAKWGQVKDVEFSEVRKTNDLFRNILKNLSANALKFFTVINAFALLLIAAIIALDTYLLVKGYILAEARLFGSEALLTLIGGVVLETIAVVAFLGRSITKSLAGASLDGSENSES